MGQAIASKNLDRANLPDPLDATAGGGGAAVSTDDLLSQLAGEEVDRLLSEAEIEREGDGAGPERTPAITTAAAVPVTSAPASPPPSAGLPPSAAGRREMPVLTTSAIPERPESAPPLTPSAARAGEGESAMAARLDEAFDQMADAPGAEVTRAEPAEAREPRTTLQPRAVGEAESAGPPIELGGEASDAEQSESAAVTTGADEPEGTTPAEREQLSASLSPPDAAPAPFVERRGKGKPPPPPAVSLEEALDDESAQSAGDASSAGGDPSLPALLRPLEWMSAPLDAYPDRMREIIGKIALVTLVNAIAILGYVWLFRHHP